MALASQSVPATQIHTDVRVSAASGANGKTGCLLDFKRYVPAPWEQQWKDHVGEWQPFMCSVMKGQRARAKQVPVHTSACHTPFARCRRSILPHAHEITRHSLCFGRQMLDLVAVGMNKKRAKVRRAHSRTDA